MLTSRAPDGRHRITELWDEETGRLTYKMCCSCFEYVLVADLWVDENGTKWDICSEQCAADCGMQ